MVVRKCCALKTDPALNKISAYYKVEAPKCDAMRQWHSQHLNVVDAFTGGV